jgi:hypothetical protein
MEPAGERRPAAERGGLAGERGEHLLGDILGELGVAADAPECDGVDEAEMPVDELGEGAFRASGDVLME